MMKRLSLLLLLLGIVVVFSVGLSTARYDIEHLSDQMKQTQQVLAEVERRSYGRDVELARRFGRLKAHVEDVRFETEQKSFERDLQMARRIGQLVAHVEDVEGRVANLEDPNMVGVLRALANTVTVLKPDGGWGSGVVLQDGLVLTAGHCSGVTMVKTLDGVIYGVESEYVHSEYDIAILRVPDIKGGIEFADPNAEMFDPVFVLGTPAHQEWEGSIGCGVITDLDFDLPGYWTDVWRYNAGTGKGNSGGPVVTPEGKLIGIHVGGPRAFLHTHGVMETIIHIIEAMEKCEF